ncbi:hypothetical protein [Synechococcus sp. CCY 9618]|uniref:hypothetical protein n=1 Tax=Synechococcus sp. CCY 9618 TaxID=2815602 RepID=UPI001C23D237|nr:hypothetical protein [Synechococcus sp. CCY 9618]
MLPVLLVVLLSVAMSHWLVEPLLRLTTPLFELDWLGWIVLAVILWLFSGP